MAVCMKPQAYGVCILVLMTRFWELPIGQVGFVFLYILQCDRFPLTPEETGVKFCGKRFSKTSVIYSFRLLLILGFRSPVGGLTH